jgi:FtsZ-interacting cell division protein ZipA
MKKFILISLIGILFGCGSRTSQKEKYLKINSEVSKTTEKAQNSTKNKSSEQDQGKIEKQEISQESKENKEKKSESSESNLRKNTSEQNIKTVKKTTYFPNGQKKSETEMNESFSKLSDEKEFYKAASESLKEKNLKKENKISSLESKNKSLLIENETILKSNKTLLKENKTKDLQTNKKTERKAFPFWLWILIGFFLRILVGFFWKWFKTTSVFAKLPIIKFKN